MAGDEPNPKQRRSRKNLWWGVGLGIFGLVLLFGMLVPNYVNPPLDGGPRGDPRMACINYLRQIDGAKQQWAIETHASSNTTPTWDDIKPYLGRDGTNGVIPKCPSGGVYTIGALTNAPTCSVKGHAL